MFLPCWPKIDQSNASTNLRQVARALSAPALFVFYQKANQIYHPDSSIVRKFIQIASVARSQKKFGTISMPLIYLRPDPFRLFPRAILGDFLCKRMKEMVARQPSPIAWHTISTRADEDQRVQLSESILSSVAYSNKILSGSRSNAILSKVGTQSVHSNKIFTIEDGQYRWYFNPWRTIAVIS